MTPLVRCIALPLALAATPLVAQTAVGTGQHAFIELFATACMDHIHRRDDLPAAIDALGGMPVAEENTVFFLGGKPGKAWLIAREQARYAVALNTDGVCSVFAQRADTEQVKADFDQLLASAPEPLSAEQRTLPGPEEGSTAERIAYAWFRPGDPSELLFTLSTSTDPGSPLQALASIAVVQRAP